MLHVVGVPSWDVFSAMYSIESYYEGSELAETCSAFVQLADRVQVFSSINLS